MKKFVDNALKREAKREISKKVVGLIPKPKPKANAPLKNFVSNAIDRELRYQTRKQINNQFRK
ncbi:MAG: hypothetical protein ACRC17_03075 [Culicoidibacterales bacterium]